MVRWRLRNDGQRPLRLVSALQPHARFHTDEVDIGPELPPGGTADLALPVRFSEPPGTVVENPFLIVRVRERDTEWRVLARVRVTAGHDGEPMAGDSVALSVDRVGDD